MVVLPTGAVVNLQDEGSLMDLISYGFERPSRQLFRGVYDQLVLLAQAYYKHKFKIDVLREVFEAFWPSAQPTEDAEGMDFGFNLLLPLFTGTHGEGKEEFERTFDYADREWTATITHKVTAYKGRRWYFINVRMPNDGFVYTKTYAAGEEMGDGVRLDMATEEAKGFLEAVMSRLEPFWPKVGPFKPQEIVMLSHGDRHKMEIKFMDHAHFMGFGLAWDYGNCNNVIRNKMGVDAASSAMFAKLLQKWA
jgi:hypothetical protein